MIDENLFFLFHKNKILKKLNLNKTKFIVFIKPLEFLDFLFLMKNSKIVFTQFTEKFNWSSMYYFSTTPRQIIKEKSNILTALQVVRPNQLGNPIFLKKIKPSNAFGDGNVAKRIVKLINHAYQAHGRRFE